MGDFSESDTSKVSELSKLISISAGLYFSSLSSLNWMSSISLETLTTWALLMCIS